MTHVDTQVEPPTPDLATDGGDGESVTFVNVSITDDDGTHRAASAHVSGTDEP